MGGPAIGHAFGGAPDPHGPPIALSQITDMGGCALCHWMPLPASHTAFDRRFAVVMGDKPPPEPSPADLIIPPEAPPTPMGGQSKPGRDLTNRATDGVLTPR